MSLFGSFFKKNLGNAHLGKWRVGDKIAGRYEIYKIITGGMGIVYLCYDHVEELPLALKTFKDQFLSSEEAQKLFKREALIWIELGRGPYIVHAYQVNKLDDRLFILFQYISPDEQGRRNLTHYFGDLNLAETLKFSIQFCYGMEYAYSKGIDAHRDVKPDNIMITSDKEVKITDFGLAKAFQEMQFKENIISASERAGLSIFQTKAGKRICGTLPYMAPEQFDGYADKRSDIYSFGVVLYQMVTNGTLPFVAQAQEEYEKLHKAKRVPIISSSLFPLIQRCLEKEPNKRHQDFFFIREKLQEILLKETGETVTFVQEKLLEARDWFNKANNLIELSKYSEAFTCYDKALELDPKYAEVYHNKGTVLNRLGMCKEAVSYCDKAIEINSKNPTFWTSKGAILARRSMFSEALQCVDEAMKIDPDFDKAHKLKEIIYKAREVK